MRLQLGIVREKNLFSVGISICGMMIVCSEKRSLEWNLFYFLLGFLKVGARLTPFLYSPLFSL